MTTGTVPTREYLARGAVMLALTAAAFWSTWVRVAEETVLGSSSAMLFAAPFGGFLTVVALTWRRRPELPIHDRQSDVIVGVVVLAIALMNQWLLLPRYGSSYVLLHVDVAAAWAYVLGCCVLLFGLRRTGRFWPAWLLLVVASPGAIRLAVYLLGGGPVAEAAVVAGVILVGPALVLARSARRAPVPATSRWGGPSVPPRQAWRSVPALILVGLLLWLAPLPAGAESRMGQGPPGRSALGQVVPEGWTEQSAENLPWATRMYGPSATLYRQVLRADSARADWDPLRRPRQAVVQTLTVSDPGLFDAYPLEMTFDLADARVSDPVSVDLGAGVSARYRTVVDDGRLLTWSLLSFNWTRSADEYQRVLILTIDDHEYDAEFPEAVPGTGATFGRLLSLLMRGSASITAADPEAKDLDLLTELGTELVEAQWTAE